MFDNSYKYIRSFYFIWIFQTQFTNYASFIPKCSLKIVTIIKASFKVCLAWGEARKFGQRAQICLAVALPSFYVISVTGDVTRNVLKKSSSWSSSIDSTTLGGSWSVQQFYSIPVCPLPSPTNQQFSSSLGILLPGPPTLTWFSLLVLFYLNGVHSVIFLVVLVFSILITWAAHLSLCDFINFIISSCFILCFNSSIVLILHVPSGFCVGP